MKLLANFIAALSNAIRHRKIMFKYPNTSKTILKVLNLLSFEGLISGYSSYVVLPKKKSKTTKKVCFKKTGLVIFFRYHKGRYNVLRKAVIISKPSWLKFISYYGLKNIIFKHPSSIFFLSTSYRNLTSSRIANKVRIGGKLIAQFN